MTVAYIIIDKRGNLKTKTKTFKTEKAMAAYLQKLEENGTLYEVLGYSE